MPGITPKRSLSRGLALGGVVVLLAGAIFYLVAARQVTMNPPVTTGSVAVPANIAGVVTLQAKTDDSTAAFPVTATRQLATSPVTVSGGGAAAGTDVVVTIVTTGGSEGCTGTADDDGNWACDLPTLYGADSSYALKVAVTGDPYSPLTRGLGVAGLVLVIIGALVAVAGGVGLVVQGGRSISLLSWLLIPVGVALDFALAALANTLQLPFFLDSVGHILAGLLGGPIIGGITGFLGVLTGSLFQPAAIVWCFQGAVIGILVGWLAQSGMFKNIGRSIASTLIVIVSSVTLSTVISMIVYGGIDSYKISALRAALVAAGWPMFWAVLTTSAVIELIDKTISVGLPLLVIAAMSMRLLNLFVTGPKLREPKTEVAAVTENAATEPLAENYGSYGEK